MVKNTIGGKKNKAFSRKDANANYNQSNALRLPQDELECFAKVTKMFGNSMCQVTLLHNNLSLIAHIRAKMTGKNKRSFTIHLNDFLIVGLRHWESSPKHCDVIHIFSQFDIDSISSLPAFSHLFIPFIYNNNNINLNNPSLSQLYEPEPHDNFDFSHNFDDISLNINSISISNSLPSPNTSSNHLLSIGFDDI
jgi:translation initiation factor IF-1